jgi:hypothetical protein
LSCFTEWCMHCLCAYFSSCVVVRFIHHAFTLLTPCFDLIDSGEQCNHIITESIIASMMISRCQLPVVNMNQRWSVAVNSSIIAPK